MMNQRLVALLDALVHIGPLPPVLDRLAARLAIGGLRFYQWTLSRRIGVTCLYQPSCSHRAVAALARLGWGRGLLEAQSQVHRCTSEYQLQIGLDGRCVLIAVDGSVIAHDDINPSIRNLERWRVDCSFTPTTVSDGAARDGSLALP